MNTLVSRLPRLGPVAEACQQIDQHRDDAMKGETAKEHCEVL